MRRRWPGVSSVASAVLLVGTVLVSAPAGASGTFSDDDGSVHEGAIEAIAAANITLGCNPPTNTKYCPDRPVTRAEMATFLTRALPLNPSTTDYFTDDNTSLHEGAIQTIAAANITLGCNPPTNTKYCPDRPVTRAEMATFLTRAFDLAPSATDYFTDDNTSLHEGAIQTIAAANITLGCNPPTNTKYCPDRPVTRAEMATFLARALDLTVVSPPPPPPPPPTGSTVVFAAAGDLGAETSTAQVLGHIGGSDAEFLLALGDLSYSHITPESSWCSWVRSKLDSTLPVQMAVGNHEHDHGSDGSWDKFAQCLPDAMSATGDYPAQYFFDLRGIVRVIVVSAGLSVDGHQYTYEPGSADAQWLTDAIRSARTSGIEWVVVGTHKPCISVGKKSCEPGRHLTDLAISEGVDLMLHGHDHNYQRTHQLSCISVNSFSPACVSDSDGSHSAGVGTVLVVSAAVRDGSLYAVSSSDSEAGFFADYMGANSADSGAGYVELTATPNSLIVEFIGVTTNHSDIFEIHN